MAIWMPDLTGRRGPKYLQIVEALAEDVASGRLEAGAKLPPHRELAYQLGLSANTTSRAYRDAVDRALLVGEVGRGTFVRGAVGLAGSGSSGNLIRHSEGPIDLSRNLPHCGSAGRLLAATLSDLSKAAGLSAFTDYQTDRSLQCHVQAALNWLGRHGVKADTSEVVLTSGAQHGILTALMALTSPGDLILVEALTYAPVRAMADRLGLKVAAIPLDEQGIVPDELEKLCRESAPKLAYLTPTLQTPTGRTLPQDRRSDVAEIARRHGLLLIEDDVFGLLDPSSPPPICTLLPEQTIYITAVSKCLAPGLRVGMVRAPEHLAGAIRGAVNLSCWMVPPLMAEIATRWIETDVADRLAGEQRQTATVRQKLAAEILGLPQDGMHRNSGFHLWLELSPEWSADRFCARALERDVKITNGGVFAVSTRQMPNAVRICLSHEADEDRLIRGLKILRGILDEGAAGGDLIL